MKRAVCLGHIMLSAVLLSGCNAGAPATAAVATGTVSSTGSTSATDSVSAGSATAADPTAQQLAQLENDGKLPKLDRSASVPGPDVDGNGVRDDIDAYLVRRFPDKTQRAAAIQMAKAVQSAVLTGGGSAEASRVVSVKLVNATNCLYDLLYGAEGANSPGAIGSEVEAITTNTKPRLMAYLAYNKSRNGTVTSLPEGDTCE